MKTDDICALPVKDITADDAHLYLWITNNHLPDGLRVIEAWGFRYITMITWFKDKVGLGQYFRGQTEHVMFAVKGMLPFKFDENGKRCQGATGFYEERTEHSRKPETMRGMIERVSVTPDRKKIELFARTQTAGWFSWGNETDKFTQ